MCVCVYVCFLATERWWQIDSPHLLCRLCLFLWLFCAWMDGWMFFCTHNMHTYAHIHAYIHQHTDAPELPLAHSCQQRHGPKHSRHTYIYIHIHTYIHTQMLLTCLSLIPVNKDMVQSTLDTITRVLSQSGLYSNYDDPSAPTPAGKDSRSKYACMYVCTCVYTMHTYAWASQGCIQIMMILLHRRLQAKTIAVSMYECMSACVYTNKDIAVSMYVCVHVCIQTKILH
jgi:hypothetical protein